MTVFRRRIGALTLLMSVVSLWPSTTVAQSKPDTSCPRYQVVQEFKQAVMSNDGEIEPIHISDGLAILATAKTLAQAKMIQAAAKQYIAATQKLTPENKRTPCWIALKAIKEGQISESATPTERGVLVTLVTRDASLREVLQQGNCCQYCICPSTNARCQGCC